MYHTVKGYLFYSKLHHRHVKYLNNPVKILFYSSNLGSCLIQYSACCLPSTYGDTQLSARECTNPKQ